MYYGQRTESRCVTVLSCGISGLEDGTHSFRWSVRASILIMHLRFFMNCQKAQLVCVFIDVPWSVRRIPTISWCKGRWPPFCALFRAATVPWIATHVPPWFFFVCVCVDQKGISPYCCISIHKITMCDHYTTGLNQTGVCSEKWYSEPR